MKKLTKILSVLSVSLLTLGFSSCMTEDEYDAYNLSGSWVGDFGMEYDGYIATRTYVEFIPDYDYATHGTGYQRDYYTGLGTMTFDIDWEIRRGVIYISYYDRYGRIDDLETVIYNYGLNGYNFWGNIGSSGGTYFSLAKTSDWYYAKSRTADGTEQGGDSIITNYDRTKVRNIYMNQEK